MKLLKYVMRFDSGLAPNPFFDVCSLALCTPNHANARLEPGDWIVGHSCKSTGNRLIHAMRLTKVLDMDQYFHDYPQKRPVPGGAREQQCGDNLYYREGPRWRRLASPAHNSVLSFQQDQDHWVYLSEGPENYWYLGAMSSLPESIAFPRLFPELVHGTQGVKYERDVAVIENFVRWLAGIEGRGRIGTPRDKLAEDPGPYITGLEPSPLWQEGLAVGATDNLTITAAEQEEAREPAIAVSTGARRSKKVRPCGC